MAHHLVLPAVSLALFYAGIYTRLMRAAMLEVACEDYVRTARAKGIAERRVTYRHVLRNALLPLVTMVGVQVDRFSGAPCSSRASSDGRASAASPSRRCSSATSTCCSASRS